ncbi:MAG: RsmD family RNA methyltransferase, partial [Firmicutes bacterium]|nr:RsmD family RNA methyltransferase [Bacillota bacterium]
RFTLVFLDPPYRMPDADAMLAALGASGVLAEDALVIFEHARDFRPDAGPFTVWDERAYGDTVLTFLAK